jgi:hypothetical protein
MVRAGAFGVVGFESFREYTASLASLPTILSRRAFSPLMPADAVVESGAAMKQVLVRVCCSPGGRRRFCSLRAAAAAACCRCRCGCGCCKHNNMYHSHPCRGRLTLSAWE